MIEFLYSTPMPPYPHDDAVLMPMATACTVSRTSPQDNRLNSPVELSYISFLHWLRRVHVISDR